MQRPHLAVLEHLRLLNQISERSEQGLDWMDLEKRLALLGMEK